MIELLALLIPFVWAGNDEVGYQKIMINETDDIEEACNHMRAIACLHEYPKGSQQLTISVITGNLHKYHHLGCTNLTHEWLHYYLGRENQIPRCDGV